MWETWNCSDLGSLVTTLHCKNIVGTHSRGHDKVSFLSCEGLDNGGTMMDFMVMDSFDFHWPHPESPLDYSWRKCTHSFPFVKVHFLGQILLFRVFINGFLQIFSSFCNKYAWQPFLKEWSPIFPHMNILKKKTKNYFHLSNRGIYKILSDLCYSCYLIFNYFICSSTLSYYLFPYIFSIWSLANSICC